MSNRSRCLGRQANRVSVIIPSWNRAHTLGMAIESVLNQSLPASEILVCDDGSTDGTSELVADIAGQDSRVRLVPGDRGYRPAIPRNRGIRESRGDWLAFLDSDDAWEPDKTALQLDSAQRMDCHAVCSNAHRVLPDGRLTGHLLDWRKPLLNLPDLLSLNRVICSSCMVRKSVLDLTGGFPTAPSFKAIEDYALWLRVATVTKFAYCAEPLVLYADDPANSVRADQTISPSLQKKLVLGSFDEWLHSCPVALPGRRTALARTWIARKWLAISRAQDQ